MQQIIGHDIIGRAILEFSRDRKVGNRVKREIVKRVEHKNNLTPWISDLLHQGNFYWIMDLDKTFPLEQFANGCLLTDRPNDPTLSMIASDSEITAQAGNDGYSGLYTKRGSYSEAESRLITGGFRKVWTWGPAYGNGPISSICLTRAEIGKAELGTTAAIPDTDAVASCLLGDPGSYGWNESDDDTLGKCQIIDYANERGYYVSYSSGTITIEVYRVPTLYLRFTDARCSAELIETHTISQTVDNWNQLSASISYTGSAIHILTWQRNTGNLKDYAIALSDLDSVTVTAHTYAGITFNDGTENWRTRGDIRKDILLIIGNYVWGYSGNKIAKCNLLGNNDADVTVYDNPLGTLSGYQNGPFVYLPNGDWYKTDISSNPVSAAAETVYQHNNRFYRVYSHRTGGASDSGGYAMNTTGNGGVLASYRAAATSSIQLLTYFPYVTTVNNLQETLTKSADLSMRLQYDVTIGGAS